MAFRRTTNIIDRMTTLGTTARTGPAATAVPAATGSSVSTLCGAVLQTIAPFCETPKFSFFKYFDILGL